MSYEQQPGWSAPQAGGYGAPPPPGGHQPYPYPQQPGYGAYAPYPPGPGGYPAVPMAMPGQVRTAQVLSFVLAGLVVIGVFVAGAAVGAEAAGKVIGANLPVIGGFICALCFGRSGNGAKVTAIVFASLMVLFGLGALGQRQPAGLLEIACGIVIIVMLAQRPSTFWFTRPRP
ncbi:hypothetical protein [Streptomyces sp. 8N706]|uniref:hypothetical protein n=1 Tax=Streptomyces sp. 8N706 TaxID=3457416 RepID=UPI003FD63CC2